MFATGVIPAEAEIDAVSDEARCAFASLQRD
jgi:hypothetical protein